MISLPNKPKITKIQDNKSVFQIEPLYPGYGVTIGNSIRRVLFSSLSGAAITKIKIKGAQHEFSTLPGVLEDIITIMLNLKQIRFKFFAEEPQKAFLKIKGEKEVKASDFKLPSQIEIINKSAHIATLSTKSANLEIEIQVEQGIGYSPKEFRKEEKLAVGEIALDSIFTPIVAVNYKVENMRVGERTDYDRLFLEIETDGTMAPEQAFLTASEILLNHFSVFVDDFNTTSKDKKKSSEKNKSESKNVEQEDVLKTKVEDLKLSNRTLNALINNNIKTVAGIVKKKEDSILQLEGMGEKGLKEIKKEIKKIGLELKEN